MKKKQKILTLLCIIYSVAFHTLILNLTLLPDNDSTNDTMTYELIKGSLIITEEYSEFSEGILENLTLYESGYLSLNSSLQAAWNELGGIPSARGRPAMAYDSAHDRMVLFGGAVSSGIYSDETWVYNLNDNTWLNATDENPKPSARWGHSMVYDSTHDRTVLFGGEDDIGHSNETWIFNLNDNTWTNITPSVGPAGRMMHAMAYDSTRERVVLFGGDPPGTGGFYSDTWILNLTDNSWTEVSPNPNPGEYFGHSLVYDSAHDRMVLFGDDDTWIYNFTDNTWTKVDSGSGPNLKHHSMAYDAVHEVSIMFGGYNSGYFDNTWTYNLTDNSWTEVDSGSGPSGRYGHSMAYDSAHGVMVMFGGNNDGNYLGDMWKFSMSNYHKRGQFISKIISL